MSLARHSSATSRQPVSCRPRSQRTRIHASVAKRSLLTSATHSFEDHQQRQNLPRPSQGRRSMASNKGQTQALLRDKIRIQATGGDGGAGCASYLRTIEGIGGPNGGNGGEGGDVLLYTDPNMSAFDLSKFHFKGGQGGSGGSDNLTGVRGADSIVPIPVGTIIRQITGRDNDSKEITTTFLADLNEPGLTVRIARGAPGGAGNRTFKGADNPKAQFTTTGGKAGSTRFELELKVLADIGLVGFPNAGKSSLLKAISNANPEVASYPFTTLQPMIGVVDIPSFTEIDVVSDSQLTAFSVADLPGLVDGAHMNIGLGHQFLRHIERTKLLMYVVDVARPGKQMRSVLELQEQHKFESDQRAAELDVRKHAEDAKVAEIVDGRRSRMASLLKSRGVPEEEYHQHDYRQLFPNDTELESMLVNKGTRRIYGDTHADRPRNINVTDLGDPVLEFLALRRELALYQPELAARPALVFANKIDRHPNAAANQLKRLREVVPAHWPVFAGSAQEGINLKGLVTTAGFMLQFINRETDSQLLKSNQKYQDLTDVGERFAR